MKFVTRCVIPLFFIIILQHHQVQGFVNAPKPFYVRMTGYHINPTKVEVHTRLKAANLEGLPKAMDVDPSDLADLSSNTAPITPQDVIALAALALGIVVVINELWQERPQGWVNEALVEEGFPSTLGPKAGKGLFARANIPKNTIIGKYPGMIYPKEQWVTRKDNEEAAILAARFTWILPNGNVVDPTLSNGDLPEVIYAFGGLIKVPTLLALTNEPPPGVDVNVLVDVTDEGVKFRAERDIYNGEELFCDYGATYDRRHYRR